MKNYISKNVKRQIPVGYAAAQIQDTLKDQWNYFRCSTTGKNDDASVTDFFALNSYSWCGNSSYKEAGYDKLVGFFGNTNTPVFFGEYGCNQFGKSNFFQSSRTSANISIAGAVKGGPRPFTEVQALYAKPMRDVFSGGNVFEYTMETNNYGLVVVNGDKSVTLRQDFINLQNNFNALNLKDITASDGTATSQPAPQCSSDLITQGLTDNFTLPGIPDNGQDLINNGVKRSGSTPTLKSITATSLPAPVKNVQGESLSWTLKVLSNDQSNAPSGNTAGGKGSGSSSNLATPTTMPKAAGIVAGTLLMGALVL